MENLAVCDIRDSLYLRLIKLRWRIYSSVESTPSVDPFISPPQSAHTGRRGVLQSLPGGLSNMDVKSYA